MKTVIFDIETDGLIKDLTRIHVISCYCIETGQMVSATSEEPQKMAKVVDAMTRVDKLVGHNIYRFDLPVLKRFYPEADFSNVQLIDTLIYGKLVYPELMMMDSARLKHGFPKKLMGSHSLKAWGFRLKNHKGTFAEDTDWKELSEDMVKYCEQDVRLNADLFIKLESKEYSPKALELEMKFGQLIARMERAGVVFDVEKAERLEIELIKRRAEIHSELGAIFKPRVIPVQNGKVFINKRNRSVKKVSEDGSMEWRNRFLAMTEYSKIQIQVFNPNSRAQIADRLIKDWGWTPLDYTDKGNPIINERTLGALPDDLPMSDLLKESLLITKRLGQLSEGKNGWLKLVTPEGKIHGKIDTVGTSTRRCSAAKPNIQQVPAVRSQYGTEMRDMFTVPPGYKMVGADASGLELRTLASFLARWDGGKYADECVNGDVHQLTADAIGLTRDQAKTFAYATLYGAGAAKIGAQLGGTADDGMRAKKKFEKNIKGYKKLIQALQNVLKKRNWIKTIDGGAIQIRSEHSVLNFLLQSTGSIVCKWWTVLVYERLLAEGYVWGKDFWLSIVCHDECQWTVREDLAEYVAKVNVEEMPKVQKLLNMNVQLDAEAKVGNSWADTH